MTNTDNQYTERLNAIMPANFMNNITASFEANKNLLDSMINRIGLTVIQGVDTPYNPFADYTSQVLNYGDTVQKYKIDYPEAEKFETDTEDAMNPFKNVRRKPYAQYATIDDSVRYHETINNFEFQKAFMSDGTLGNFVSSKLEAMYAADGLDKYIKWKKYMSDFSKFGAYEGIEADASDTDVFAGNLWDTLRTFANNKFHQPNNTYNIAKHTVFAPNVDVIMRADDKLLVDKYLKGVYNLDKTTLDANIKLVDDFATPSNIPSTITDTMGELVAIVADHRAFQYYPRTPQSGSIYNPKSLDMQYYVIVEGTYCIDRTRNIVGIYKKK